MKWVISRYNHDLSYLKEYTDDYVLYDRSETPLSNSIIVPNIGSDIYDKLTFIIDNYDHLPSVAIYTKANIFKYITKEEFDAIKDNTKFTPILTQHHQAYDPVCYYKDGMYYEINNRWYLQEHRTKHLDTADKLLELLKIKHLDYIPFAPGSNYILPKENILQHPKAHYETLRSFLAWSVYPGEAQIIERGLFILWNTP